MLYHLLIDTTTLTDIQWFAILTVLNTVSTSPNMHWFAYYYSVTDFVTQSLVHSGSLIPTVLNALSPNH